MIIIGIDPGTATTGFAVLDVPNMESPLPNLIETNILRTTNEMTMHDRLYKLYIELGELIEKYTPELMVIEKLFFNTNAKTAMTVGQARGVILLAAATNKIIVEEYTALQAKKVLTGYGRASKKEMQEAVKKHMHLDEVVKSDDANDAIAIVLCHLYKSIVFENVIQNEND